MHRHTVQFCTTKIDLREKLEDGYSSIGIQSVCVIRCTSSRVCFVLFLVQNGLALMWFFQVIIMLLYRAGEGKPDGRMGDID